MHCYDQRVLRKSGVELIRRLPSSPVLVEMLWPHLAHIFLKPDVTREAASLSNTPMCVLLCRVPTYVVDRQDNGPLYAPLSC